MELVVLYLPGYVDNIINYSYNMILVFLKNIYNYIISHMLNIWEIENKPNAVAIQLYCYDSTSYDCDAAKTRSTKIDATPHENIGCRKLDATLSVTTASC
jgi:hypothetical protein